jgi:tetratricopeptide (TPR) repeat protein
MTARLKGLSPFFTCNLAYSPLFGAISYGLPELMDPANPNCLPPPPAEGGGGAPVPSDDDMLNVAQVRSTSHQCHASFLRRVVCALLVVAACESRTQMLYALAPRSSDGNSMSYLNHGCECHASGDYEQAIELYVKALNVRLQFFGANSLPVGQVYSLVAHTLHAAGEIDDAEEFYALALDIRADMLRSLEQKGLGGDFLPLATAAHAIEYNNCAPISLRGSGSELISHEIVAAAAASVNHDMPGDMCARPRLPNCRNFGLFMQRAQVP